MNLEPLLPLKPFLPVLPLNQGPAASSQEPAASANSGDENSEYSDEKSAQSQDSGRTGALPETHMFAAAAGSFCFVTTDGEKQDNLPAGHYAMCETMIVTG